jgi:MFS family permease
VAISAFVIVLLMHGARFSFGIFFIPILTEFGWTRAMTSGAFSMSWIVQALSSIFMGNLNDKVGPRIVVSLCGLLFGLGYLLMSQVNNVWEMYLFYGLLIGIGSSGTQVSLVSTTIKWFMKRKNLAISIVTVSGEIGTLVMPLVAVRLIDAYDWRMSYVIIGSFILVLVVIISQFLKRSPVQTKNVSFGEDSPSRRLKMEELCLKEAIHTKQFWIALALQFLTGFLAITIMIHIVPHAIDVGISAISAANILGIMGGLGIIGRLATGFAGDRLGIKWAYIICFLVAAVSYFGISSVKEIEIFYLFAIMIGMARHSGLLAAPLVSELFGLKAHGLIYGVMVSGISIGAAAGTYLVGYIFDMSSTYMVAFMLCGILSIVAVILAMLLPSARLGVVSMEEISSV